MLLGVVLVTAVVAENAALLLLFVFLPLTENDMAEPELEVGPDLAG